MIHKSRIDLSPQVRERIMALLQAQLSDALDLEAQLKQAHWNVKGKSFLQLHGLFDDAHGAVEEFVDMIAERIVALEGVADGRVQTTAQTSRLRAYPLAAQSAEAHLSAVADALAAFGATLRKNIDDAASAGDQGTADLLTGISRENDKRLWLVEAHLA